MYRLMQPTPHLPSDHPLLQLGGSEASRWTQREIQTFQQALTKYDKDFMRVSKEVSRPAVRVGCGGSCEVLLWGLIIRCHPLLFQFLDERRRFCVAQSRRFTPTYVPSCGNDHFRSYR